MASIFDTLLIRTEDNILKLREEREDDNIEYKLRLNGKTPTGEKIDMNLKLRHNQLISQMNFRMDIGKYSVGKRLAHYILGVKDDGTFGNLTEEELDETFTIFSKLVSNCHACIEFCEKKKEYKLIHVIIQKIDHSKIQEINLAFVGPSQHGKTTTISNLVYNICDDGSGYSRKLVLRHEHEKLSGLTSCIKKEIIGMKDGNIIDFSSCVESSTEEIVRMSDKIINLIDLPGNTKYLKTTLFGLCAYRIDALIVVFDISKKEDYDIIYFYKALAKALNIPIQVLLIKTKNLDYDVSGDNIVINNVNRMGYDLVIKYLNTLHQRKVKEMDQNLFNIVDIYDVPDTGLIFSGMMMYGNLSLHDTVYLTNGINTYNATIKSIHRKQVDSHTIYHGETGAIQLDLEKVISDKNMIITTTEKHELYKSIKFKLIYRLGKRLKNQLSLLFIENNIIMVNIDYVSDEIILRFLDKQIIIHDLNAIVFLKNSDGIYLGHVYGL